MSTSNLQRRVAFRSVSSFEDVAVEEETPENFVMEHFAPKPRTMSHHLENLQPPSRRKLRTQARIWRYLMRLGMRFHGMCPPRPPKPDFVRKIQTDTVPIELFFYVPQGYTLNEQKDPGHRYPIVVNFHGGGFTLGHATDDRYFARVILEQTNAVFVSVNYRLAPEHPFPIPVDDCVEALMWLSSHATELRLDPRKTALTGFSAGGNLSFTVPFRLTYHTNPSQPRLHPGPGSRVPSEAGSPNISRIPTRESVEAGLNPEVNDEEDLNPRAAKKAEIVLPKPVSKDRSRVSSTSLDTTPTSSSTHLVQSDTHSSEAHDNGGDQHGDKGHVHFRQSEVNPEAHPDIRKADQEQQRSRKQSRPQFLTRQTTLNTDRPSNIRIVSIIAFYPLLDWTSSRSAKVRSSRKPSATLKKTFTDLFDHSYLPPPDDAQNHVSPFASPGLAPTQMIREGLPTKIQMYLCEYDMLLAEGEEFINRMKKLGKDVYTEMIEKVPHGWDKSPNPFRNQKKIDALYMRSARELQGVFDEAEEQPEELRGQRISIGGLR